MPRLTWFSRLVSCSLLCFLLPSPCRAEPHWQPIQQPYQAGPQPSPIRIAVASGHQYVLYQATIQDDQLTGFTEKPYDSVKPAQRSFPLDSIVRMEYDPPTPAETFGNRAGIVVGVAALAVVAFFIFLDYADGPSWE